MDEIAFYIRNRSLFYNARSLPANAPARYLIVPARCPRTLPRTLPTHARCPRTLPRTLPTHAARSLPANAPAHAPDARSLPAHAPAHAPDTRCPLAARARSAAHAQVSLRTLRNATGRRTTSLLVSGGPRKLTSRRDAKYCGPCPRTRCARWSAMCTRRRGRTCGQPTLGATNA